MVRKGHTYTYDDRVPRCCALGIRSSLRDPKCKRPAKVMAGPFPLCTNHIGRFVAEEFIDVIVTNPETGKFGRKRLTLKNPVPGVREIRREDRIALLMDRRLNRLSADKGYRARETEKEARRIEKNARRRVIAAAKLGIKIEQGTYRKVPKSGKMGV